MDRRRFAGAVVAGIVGAALATGTADAAGAPGPTPVTTLSHKAFTLDGAPVPARPEAPLGRRAGRALTAGVTPPVGTVRQWLGTDDLNGTLYRKDYTLRAVGQHVEVWVADDLAFPAGDCRASVPGTTTVTDAQVASLVHEFDTNIYPKETATFSTPPDRDGTNALLGPDANGNGGVYTGGGEKTVTLVDNVRDDNFYDFPAAQTYIAGFYSSQYDELFDRNVMTIDAFDWAHRTGANPPDAPTADPCTSRPAKPYLYESTFAHEWQHLLQDFVDPNESVWLNEGLSDYAQTLTGLVDASRTVDEAGSDNHLYCFTGFGTVQTPFNPNPRDCGGPQDSLNLWNEGSTGDAVLADYGHAYSFLLYLADRFGTGIISRLHRDGDLHGIASVSAALQAQKAPAFAKVLHDYESMVLLDKPIGDARLGIVLGVPRSRVTTPSLRFTVNLANPAAYAAPGAAPNGADYVRLRRADGTPLRGRDLRSLAFRGAATLPPVPSGWTTVTTDPDRPGDAVLASPNASSTDATAVLQVTVPTADPTLRFLAKYGAELGYDYGYVEVSTDGGATYTAIPGDKTVDAPLGPGLNGTTDGFEPHAFDLSAYAGKTVLLAFRYVSDGGVNEGGLLLDDVTLGATTLSDGTNLAAFRSPSEIRPIPVGNWDLKLVGLDAAHHVALQAELDGRRSVTLNRLELLALAPFDTVVAVVANDDPTEQQTQYAPYSLTVNGVKQPGGGQ